MTGGTYELVRSDDGEYTARVSARGLAVLAAPAINRGTAFTYEQRAQLGLTGLLPTGVSTLDSQLRRTYAQFRQQSGDLAKWVYLTNLRSRNDVLFYRLLADHIEDGRKELNFSVWNTYTPKKKVRKLDELCDQVELGEMPLPSYLWVHRDAVMQEGDAALLCNWAKAEGERIKRVNGPIE